ncbi:adenylyltransferase/cytidyltransferase family protein [bacterium]|nr:adenylyltransferase/cytidyltransferase family protein [bacterium]
MKKVITYGTYDLLHYGHIRLLERAKKLGDYLIVGVTSDDFDKARGKINVQQSLIERIEAIRSLNIADEIIVEEYEGQKIDDIKKYGIDIFTVGSDWVGKFDYLKEFCEVVYLDRTEGVSSSDIRKESNNIRLGLVGESRFLNKFYEESKFVNGVEVVGICTNDVAIFDEQIKQLPIITKDYNELLENVDAVHIHSEPVKHYEQIKTALINHKHVLCESPITLSTSQTQELIELAKDNGVILLDGIRTAYCTAFSRMVVLAKSGIIGNVVSVDATCTSLSKNADAPGWNSIYSWGPVALLPVFDILGTNYKSAEIVTSLQNQTDIDLFTKINFIYESAVASIKVAKFVKSEGDLVISGTKGYIYVPSPWWKTSYFEVRYENFSDNKKYFYQFEGQGLRYEIAYFNKLINQSKDEMITMDQNISKAIVAVMEAFCGKREVKIINFDTK